jgi:hypothetical protein
MAWKMADDRVLERLKQLIDMGTELLRRKQISSFDGYEFVEPEAANELAMSAGMIIATAFGEGSIHYAHAKECATNPEPFAQAQKLVAILRSARSDWEGGYYKDVKALAGAEVGADLLDQASVLADGKYNHAAVVLAGATLEQHLRGMCTARGISTLTDKGKRKTMEPLNEDLRKHNPPPFDAYWAKRITAWGDLRSTAAHGDPFDETQTKPFIEQITDFCARFK